MNCKPITYISLLIVFLFLGMTTRAQELQDGRPEIDSAMAISPDYMPTHHAPWPSIQFLPLNYDGIDTNLIHIAEYDPLWRLDNLYQSIGINGQAHKSMIFDIQKPSGFSMVTLPYPLYFP